MQLAQACNRGLSGPPSARDWLWGRRLVVVCATRLHEEEVRPGAAEVAVGDVGELAVNPVAFAGQVVGELCATRLVGAPQRSDGARGVLGRTNGLGAVVELDPEGLENVVVGHAEPTEDRGHLLREGLLDESRRRLREEAGEARRLPVLIARSQEALAKVDAALVEPPIGDDAGRLDDGLLLSKD